MPLWLQRENTGSFTLPFLVEIIVAIYIIACYITEGQSQQVSLRLHGKNNFDTYIFYK